MTDPDKRQVTVSSARPFLTVTGWLGADPSAVTQGYGGWTTVARPRRQSLTTWEGHEPYGIDLSMVLDGFAKNESVESKCTAIERMARPPRVLDEPPKIRISGAVPHNDLVWVIQSIRWAEVIRNETGDRVRQNLTISFLRYIADDRVQLAGAAARARQAATASKNKKSSGAAPTYTVKKGDALTDIAARELGDYKRWVEIARLNNIRDPKSIHPGQKLRMP